MKRSIRKNIFLYNASLKAYGFKRTTCVICLSKIENLKKIKRTPCGHIFHTKCISGWLRQKKSCPCCRLNLKKKKKISLSITPEIMLNNKN